jgi:hypothetical protein
MKRFLSIVALSPSSLRPAFALSGSHAGSDRDAQWSSRVLVYAPDYYVRRGTMNNEVNPDFQLGGSHGN